MGIDIVTYRVRIGTFSTKFKCEAPIPGKPEVVRLVNKIVMRNCMLVVCIVTLLILAGDVEQNPSPGPGSGSNTPKADSSNIATRSGSRNTKQPQLNFQAQGSAKGENPNIDSGGITNLLNEIRAEMNTRFDSLGTSIQHLRTEMIGKINKLDERVVNLESENKKLWQTVFVMEKEIETLQAKSKQNNLIIHGISNVSSGSKHDLKNSIRTFLKSVLKLNPEEVDDMEFVNCSRLPTKGNPKPILVTFECYSDKCSILTEARKKPNKDNLYRVSEDFTKRVRRTRQLLTKFLLDAREQGKEAHLRYDKLIINNEEF